MPRRINKHLLMPLLLLISQLASGQPIQKYVIDGKTYYGTPPPGLSLDVEVEDVPINNTHVEQQDYERAIERREAIDEAHERDAREAEIMEWQQKQEQERYREEILDSPGYYEREKEKSDQMRREHDRRMDRLRCSPPRQWTGSSCR